jgi:predicted metal-dependent HD superfamily phosphohydrolase
VRIDASWQRACDGLEWQGDSTSLREQLLARYTEPHRKYHTRQHLAECIALLEPVLHLAQHPAEVEMALWFHDAVYETRRHDNEAQSAAWAQRALLAAGVGVDSAARVHELVMATCHTALPATADAQLLVDIDLAILGAPPERFAEYERQIRLEYGFVPGWLFRRKRRAVLRSFAQRTPIYHTTHFRERCETQARQNLQLALAG